MNDAPGYLLVWKYPLKPGKNLVTMPRFARALAVAFQYDILHVWLLVDQDAATVRREFYVALTGQKIDPFDAAGQFVGTAMNDNGSFVVHVFDLGERP